MTPATIENIPNRSSQGQEWLQWHKDLKSRYGKKRANSIFIRAWGLRGKENSSANTSQLRDYLKGQGIQLETSTISSLYDAAADVGDFFGDIFVVGKYIGIGLGVILVGGIGMLIFNIAKSPVEVIKSIR